MPDLESNRTVWSRSWDWSREGDDWSDWWGGTHAMWLGAWQPRLQSFVPARRILEIAPGFGRWTQYLKDLAAELVVVDLTEKCIAHCRDRFATATNITYHVNDGRSLARVDDRSIDLAVSFDSLVHAEPDVIRSYVLELSAKLADDGIAVIHHSNAGAYRSLSALTKRVPASARARLIKRGVLLDVGAWRDGSMTGDQFVEFCNDAGLACVGQERISWEHGPYLIDAISTVTRRGSQWDRPPRRHDNRGFSNEALRMRSLWAPSSFGPAAPRRS